MNKHIQEQNNTLNLLLNALLCSFAVGLTAQRKLLMITCL